MNFNELKNKADQFVKEKEFQKGIEWYDKIISNEKFQSEAKLKNIHFNKGYCLFNILFYE